MPRTIKWEKGFRKNYQPRKGVFEKTINQEKWFRNFVRKRLFGF